MDLRGRNFSSGEVTYLIMFTNARNSQYIQTQGLVTWHSRRCKRFDRVCRHTEKCAMIFLGTFKSKEQVRMTVLHPTCQPIYDSATIVETVSDSWRRQLYVCASQLHNELNCFQFTSFSELCRRRRLCRLHVVESIQNGMTSLPRSF